MKPQLRARLTFALGLAALAAGGILISQWSERRTLAEELAALPPADDGPRARAGTGTTAAPKAPPGGGLNLLLKPFAAQSGDEARRELVRQLHVERAAANRDPFGRLAPLLESLSVRELLAVIGSMSAAEFTLTADGPEGTARQEIDGAIARLAALRRLCVLAPEQALAVCAAGAPAKAADPLINVTALALRQRSRENPSAALRWGKENASWLPASWPAWVLTDVARREGLASAGALARQEGVLLAESMRWCPAGSLEDIATLMTEVDRERAAASEKFMDSPLVRRGYQAVAEKICDSLGFEEGRKFAEKWTAGLPWQEDTALTVFQSTLNPASISQTPAAADWVISFVPEDRRAAAAAQLMLSWTGPDFTQWLAQNRAAPWHDPALAAHCRRQAATDPAATAPYAAAITDETLRAATLAAFPKSFSTRPGLQ